VLVYFGYPAAHEDDAERAVHAGLELCSAVGALKASCGFPLKCRIGIATGLVIAGDADRERGIIGDAPNLAMRLQALAEPNTVAIDRTTAIEITEAAEPVEAWQVSCLITPCSSAPTPSNNMIQKGLAFSRDWSGSVVNSGR
jgi:class 3 adenylate cyclase